MKKEKNNSFDNKQSFVGLKRNYNHQISEQLSSSIHKTIAFKHLEHSDNKNQEILITLSMKNKKMPS